MRIDSIEIQNFRSLKNVTTSFESLVAIVGRNNSGKSSILQALYIFYAPGYRAEIEDFYNRETGRYVSMAT